MKIGLFLYVSILTAFLAGCNLNNNASDASGTFEADEVVVSSEVPGKILMLNLEEGSMLAKDSVVGIIDSVPLLLQKAQVEATKRKLRQLAESLCTSLTPVYVSCIRTCRM